LQYAAKIGAQDSAIEVEEHKHDAGEEDGAVYEQFEGYEGNGSEIYLPDWEGEQEQEPKNNHADEHGTLPLLLLV
jgi:hypothetical protein